MLLWVVKLFRNLYNFSYLKLLRLLKATLTSYRIRMIKNLLKHLRLFINNYRLFNLGLLLKWTWNNYLCIYRNSSQLLLLPLVLFRYLIRELRFFIQSLLLPLLLRLSKNRTNILSIPLICLRLHENFLYYLFSFLLLTNMRLNPITNRLVPFVLLRNLSIKFRYLNLSLLRT